MKRLGGLKGVCHERETCCLCRFATRLEYLSWHFAFLRCEVSLKLNGVLISFVLHGMLVRRSYQSTDMPVPSKCALVDKVLDIPRMGN